MRGEARGDPASPVQHAATGANRVGFTIFYFPVSIFFFCVSPCLGSRLHFGAFPFPLRPLFRRIFCCVGAEVAHR